MGHGGDRGVLYIHPPLPLAWQVLAMQVRPSTWRLEPIHWPWMHDGCGGQRLRAGPGRHPPGTAWRMARTDHGISTAQPHSVVNCSAACQCSPLLRHADSHTHKHRINRFASKARCVAAVCSKGRMQGHARLAHGRGDWKARLLCHPSCTWLPLANCVRTTLGGGRLLSLPAG
jgi:hypothetical protein